MTDTTSATDPPAPYLVLGGTGKTGRRVTAQLQSRGRSVRVASRSASTHFDWHDPSSWEPAVAGAAGIYLVIDDGDDGSALRRFVDLAVSHGVPRLVLLSAREWRDLAIEGALAAEQIVQESGAEWTILRPVWFAQNFSEEAFLSDGVARGELGFASGEGAHPFIDATDIAEVAVAALVEPGHAGQTYELSGPRAMTFPEAVTEIAAATGREIRTLPLTPEEYVEHLVTQGHYPRPVAESVSGLFAHIRAGHDAYLSDGVRRALGREPRDFTDYVKATTATGGWGRATS